MAFKMMGPSLYKKQGALKKYASAAMKKTGAKPDYIDIDKDGNKKEPMTKALAEKKKGGVVAAKKGRKITKKKPTIKKSKRSGAKPKNAALYARVKAEAKRKFKVYPSAYANAWLVRTYKKRGGTYA